MQSRWEQVTAMLSTLLAPAILSLVPFVPKRFHTDLHDDDIQDGKS